MTDAEMMVLLDEIAALSSDIQDAEDREQYKKAGAMKARLRELRAELEAAKASRVGA
jgi:hypothetical protein